jgi:hypothetical protein
MCCRFAILNADNGYLTAIKIDRVPLETRYLRGSNGYKAEERVKLLKLL